MPPCIGAAEEPELLSVSPNNTPGTFQYGGMLVDSVAPLHRRHDAAKPDNNYLILKPNEAFEVNEATGIVVQYGRALSHMKHLDSGEYFLQASFTTWRTERSDTVPSLELRWKKYGTLFSGILTPDPVKIDIAVPARPPDCQPK